MSEFTCRNGHLLKAGEKSCPECGERMMYMDGLSSRELRLKEKYEREHEYEETEDEDEE